MLFCSGLHPIQQAKHWLLLANLLLWSVKGQKFRVRRFAKTWLSNVQWDKSEEVKKMTSTFRLYTKTEWRRCQSRILLSVIFVILFYFGLGKETLSRFCFTQSSHCGKSKVLLKKFNLNGFFYDIEFEFMRQKWNYLEVDFLNKQLYFATVWINSLQFAPKFSSILRMFDTIWILEPKMSILKIWFFFVFFVLVLEFLYFSFHFHAQLTLEFEKCWAQNWKRKKKNPRKNFVDCNRVTFNMRNVIFHFGCV